MRKNDQLKVIGLLIMVVDHIALFLFGGIPWLYALARFIGFPFFAYGVAVGASKTSRPLGYLKRLLVFALCCQPIFFYATGETRLNVVFTLTLGAAAVMLWRSGNRYYQAFAVVLPLVGGSWSAMNVGYGAYGVYSILAFGVSPAVAFFYQMGAALWFLQFGNIQFLACLSLLFIYVLPVPTIRLPKWIYYVSYPGHLAAIAAVKVYMP